MSLNREFYERDTAKVARDLLGKILLRKDDDEFLKGMIVETEAYFGEGDPASRAKENKTKINEIMWEKGGITLVYMVHGHWLFNITTEGKDIPGAVLIRGVEPLQGLEKMRGWRNKEEIKELASGPGKFTQAFGISKDHHGIDVTTSNELSVKDNKNRKNTPRVETSHRIGVTEDLDRELRFYISGNKNVSR